MNPSDEKRTEILQNFERALPNIWEQARKETEDLMEPDNSLQERLKKANQEIDKHLPDLWKRAEHNLKEMEKEYYKK
ncbi:hypothetical protein NYE69_12715 [Paenibacillus sp. FSL R5-0527]|uniref:Uncharacterized protein n=1 Tax=Paenibacillus macerans TaxID=44252 RepID=A0A090Y4N4_PAEMA|nr:hypothetical protein [Paenibacillus macerans]KFM93136.1 hypothetical protein DJ90_2931 [Paenibacillus macerans]MCY7558546.1 hypothetical protein [Paenibacillus macerans]MEC0153946.1 hypothetical protein [Paenibacillus macerans]OMG48382.1 hypothetical protein BK140_16960 [Paenibacillus macerans]SUA84781.1 Uncharacterised protein [Paenibacillus macerans]